MKTPVPAATPEVIAENKKKFGECHFIIEWSDKNGDMHYFSTKDPEKHLFRTYNQIQFNAMTKAQYTKYDAEIHRIFTEDYQNRYIHFEVHALTTHISVYLGSILKQDLVRVLA